MTELSHVQQAAGHLDGADVYQSGSREAAEFVSRAQVYALLAIEERLGQITDALKHGAQISGAPPGPCPSHAPQIWGVSTVSCTLRAGHLGDHEREASFRESYLRWPA
jgi:hypothetical protein